MQSIKQLYKIGYGPSSSHTIAPCRFVEFFLKENGIFDSYEVSLSGSLALTAKGHGTLNIIKRTLNTDKVEFSFDYENSDNLMVLTGIKGDLKVTWHAYSLGGGSISIEEFDCKDSFEVYKEQSFNEIKKTISERNISLLDYIYEVEPDLKDYLKIAIEQMISTVDKGLNSEGLLNSELNYYRIASKLYKKAKTEKDKIIAYSYAANEENAAGGKMCTSPTLGACGIINSLIYYLKVDKKEPIEKLCDILAISGIFGNVVKNNASIAGSTGGCQAEVGTACSMAAAGIAYYQGASLKTIEYAAEMGIEHFLGLTCDPVLGYVIIPCIERNAMGILRSFECAYLASQLNGIKDNAISFDSVVLTMNYTGSKLAPELKETSLGGLALEYLNEKN